MNAVEYRLKYNPHGNTAFVKYRRVCITVRDERTDAV